MYGLIAIMDEKYANITNEDTMLEYPIPSKCFMKHLNAPASMHKIFCFIDVIALILASTTNHGIVRLSFLTIFYLIIFKL